VILACPGLRLTGESYGADVAVKSTDAVTTYRKNLPPGDLIDFPYTRLDRLDIPAYSTAFWPEEGAFCNGLGYGTSEAEAMTSAFGELFESAAAGDRLPLMLRVNGSYNELARRYGDDGVLDPVEACLEAGTAYDHDRVLDWIEARRFPEGTAVLVELAATRFADLLPAEQERERLLTPITNGLGAGPSLEHALSHALLELVQRDGNSVDYRALDRGIAVDAATTDPETRDLLTHLDDEDVEIIVKLATSDLGMANFYVVGYDRNPKDAPHPLALSACGEAAHPNREIALRKSLLEYVAARARELFNHAPLEAMQSIAPLATSTAFAITLSAAKKNVRSRRCSGGSPSLPGGCTNCWKTPSTRSAPASRSRISPTPTSTRETGRRCWKWWWNVCTTPTSMYSTWTIRPLAVR